MSEHVSFPPKTLEKFIKLYCPPDIKISADALTLSNELLYLFAKDALQRAAHQAQETSVDEVGTDQVLKIIPGMLCDF